MKIICQSCGTKYTIADEKVRGRTVKIRCKKCSSAIVVKGPAEAPPPNVEEEEEDDATRVYSGSDVPGAMAMSVPPHGQPPDPGWMVTLDDGAQREGSIGDLRAMYEAGVIHEDSYVWRDGMLDWQTLGDTPELLNELRAAPSAGAPRPVAGAPSSQLGGNLFGSGGQAARVESRNVDRDLFGASSQQQIEEEEAASGAAAPMEKPQVPKFTAERGETSVLFTIDTVKAIGKQSSKPARAPSTSPEERVDFGALASEPAPPLDDGNLDVPSFDPGPGPAEAGASLSAPMLPTTFEPEPEPEPSPQVPFDTPPKSNKGLVIGLSAAVAFLLVVGVVFGGYFLFGKSEEPVASNTTEADKGGDKVSADTDTKDEDTKDEDTKDEDTKDEDTKDEDTKDEAKDDESEATSDDKDDESETTSDDKNVGRAKPLVGGPLPASTKKADTTKKDDKKADTTKKDDKADDKKDDKAAAPKKKFSRSAAISALGAAAGAATGCKKPGGPTGRGRVSVTFAPSGRVTTAVVSGPPFAGTSVGGCVAATFRRARVPAFKGSPVTVHKSFTIR